MATDRAAPDGPVTGTHLRRIARAARTASAARPRRARSMAARFALSVALACALLGWRLVRGLPGEPRKGPIRARKTWPAGMWCTTMESTSARPLYRRQGRPRGRRSGWVLGERPPKPGLSPVTSAGQSYRSLAVKRAFAWMRHKRKSLDATQMKTRRSGYE